MQQVDFWGRTSLQYKFNHSIQLLREFERVALDRNPLGYAVGYSGGKDSDVLLDIFKASGVKHFVIHNHTTIDSPDTVYYIRNKFSILEDNGITCRIFYPRYSFWDLCIKEASLPLRKARFCCAELKEQSNDEIKFACHSFGVRKAESNSRKKKRDSLELRNVSRKNLDTVKKFRFDNSDEVKNTGMCYSQKYFYVNPIVYFSDIDIYEYISGNNIKLNPQYKKGFSRIGCIGCPMAQKQRIQQFEIYPKYRAAYLRLCDKIQEERKERGLRVTNSGVEYFHQWLYEPKQNNPAPLLDF